MLRDGSPHWVHQIKLECWTVYQKLVCAPVDIMIVRGKTEWEGMVLPVVMAMVILTVVVKVDWVDIFNKLRECYQVGLMLVEVEELDITFSKPKDFWVEVPPMVVAVLELEVIFNKPKIYWVDREADTMVTVDLEVSYKISLDNWAVEGEERLSMMTLMNQGITVHKVGSATFR